MIGTNEKKAILGVTAVLVFFTFSILFIGKKNFWFSSITHYKTIIKNAEGLQVGADITISGFRVGKVTSLKVDEENNILLDLGIYSEMAHKIKKGTKSKVLSSYLIGKKKIALIPNTKQILQLEEFGTINSLDTQNLTDIVSSENISDAFMRLDSLTKNIETSLNSMGKLSEVINTKLIKTNLLQSTLKDTKAFIGPFKANSKRLEELIVLVHSLASEINKNPDMTKNVATALQEAIITLKAIQKTWILENHVKKIKEK